MNHYPYNGQLLTAKEWGMILGISTAEVESKLATMSVEEALNSDLITAPLTEDEKFALVELDPFDPDLELKRMIKRCKKQGMTDEEIWQKHRSI